MNTTANSQQRIALVTGAGSGIGEACAHNLARNGYHVVVVDLEAQRATKVTAAIEADGGRAEPAVLDVADAPAVDALVADVVARHGRLDAAVNNAGIGTGRASVADIDLNSWHRTIDVNLHGTLYCLRAELRAMRSQGYGAVVNMGSIMSVLGSEQTAAYAASKHAVLGLTRTAALDHAKDGIRVNCVCPGFVRTDLFETTLIQEQQDFITAQHPRGQVAAPHEIAALVSFLLSDAAANMTGGYYANDGGYTVR
ncbi:SDR family NAD(P)-dependent oxidoreductase [Dactylosporangium sp. CA-233914]|uniref:SDR family NAD(P)-dependent oxidoreductase n=1 Tax=Dactylosporangium sp. CA-233914 TaxID=3239934 RepID=UPI003D92F88A